MGHKFNIYTHTRFTHLFHRIVIQKNIIIIIIIVYICRTTFFPLTIAFLCLKFIVLGVFGFFVGIHALGTLTITTKA